jgi:hypothetical protein
LNCALNCAGLPVFTVTPGCSCARLRKLRPFSGRFSICVRPTTPCTLFEARSTFVAEPTTVSASVRVLISSVTLTVVVVPVATSTGLTVGWNPEASLRTS